MKLIKTWGAWNGWEASVKVRLEIYSSLAVSGEMCNCSIVPLDEKLRDVLEKTEALDLAYLFLCLAKHVNEMNPAYVSPMLQFELPALARNEIQRFIKYNFCPFISCPFHVNSHVSYIYFE